MSSFTEKLILSPLSDGEKWVLRKEFSYDIGFKGSKNTIVIPVGFVTNFASIPKILWSILPPIGKYTSISILHDYLYYV